MLTSEQWDQVEDLKHLIRYKVHKLVNQLTANVPGEVDDAVRQQLTEEFRFWRQDDV